jgi:hypothetical protein
MGLPTEEWSVVMTDQKPETLPERNWEQEAISLIAAEAGYLVSVLTGIVEAYGLGRGFWSDAAVAIAVRECAARLQSESRVAELTRQVESLKQQLQGATANEQSMVNEEAHDRDELALLVQQKDALSVANQTLREALEKVEWIMVNDTQAGKGRS